MTAFEKFIESKGGKLINGSIGSFNTYDNVSRTWIVGETNAIIQIGIFSYDDKTIIGVLRPVLMFLPTSEDEFEDLIFYFSGFEMSKELNPNKLQLFKEQ